jgi:hypothetical protein
MSDNNFLASRHVKGLIDRVDRRGALKKLLFGAGVAAVTPILGGIPGVHAATLGVEGQEFKILELTGTSLRSALAHLKTMPEYQTALSNLGTKGFLVNESAAEGFQFYRATAGHWSSSLLLSLRFTSQDASLSAGLLYQEKSQGNTCELVIANKTTKVATTYNVTKSGLELKATIEHKNGKTYVTAANGTTTGLNLPSDTLSPSSVVSSSSASPNLTWGCGLCVGVCTALLQGGCSWIGAAAECGIICVGPEDVPCYAICLTLFWAVCELRLGGTSYIICKAIGAC